MAVRGASEADSITNPTDDQCSEQYFDSSNEEIDEDTKLMADLTA